MSQKINPISFRLGLFQVWNIISTTYDNRFNFFYFNKKLNLESYITCFFKNNNLFLGSINWVLNKQNLFLIITYTTFSDILINTSYLNSRLSNILKSIFNLSSKIYLIRHFAWFDSSAFLLSYVNYSILKGNSFKQTFKNVNEILHAKLNTKKVLYTTKGPLTLKLKGFKIKSSGRFDNSRNQMSSSLQYKVGSLPMPELNNYVEYIQKELHTKSGVCSLHVWLIFST